MASEKYLEAKKALESCIADAPALKQALDAFYQNLSIFYNTMRWDLSTEGNSPDCTEEEYEALFDPVYRVEQESIATSIFNVNQYLDYLISNPIPDSASSEASDN